MLKIIIIISLIFSNFIQANPSIDQSEYYINYRFPKPVKIKDQVLMESDIKGMFISKEVNGKDHYFFYWTGNKSSSFGLSLKIRINYKPKIKLNKEFLFSVREEDKHSFLKIINEPKN